MGSALWEDAPQELRSRLWMALLDHPEFVGTLTEEMVRPAGLKCWPLMFPPMLLQ